MQWKPRSLSAGSRLFLALAIAALGAGLSSARAVAAGAPSSEGAAFRSFMHDLVAAAGAPADRQVGELKQVLRAHPQSREWLLSGDPDHLSRAAGLESGMAAVVSSALAPRGPLGQMKGALGRVPASQFGAALDRVPDAMWRDLGQDIDGAVDGIRLSRTSAISMLLAPSGKIEVPGTRDMQWLIGGYFDHVPVEDKRAMLLATLELSPTATSSEQLAAVLHTAGPVAQKMFQLLGQDSRSAEVRQVMQQLKSRVRPFSDKEARRMIESKLGIDIEATFTSFERVGSATTGQVYRATLRKGGRVVAIKVLRPGIREKAARDMRTLRLLTPGSFERDLVDTIGRKVDEELDLEIEAKNIEEGKVYRRGRSILVPERDRAFRSGKDVLVTSFADGVTLDRPVAGADPKSRAKAVLRRGRALERLFSTLLEEALTSGIVHADLHGGNLIEMKGRWGRPRLAVVDWGSAVRLSSGEQRGLVRLALAVASRSPQGAVEALDEMSPLPEGRKARLLAAVEPLVGRSDGLPAVIDAAIAHGLRLSEGIVGFSRSSKFVLEQIGSVNRELGELDPAGKLGRARIVRSAAWGAARAAARDLARSAAARIPGRGPRQPGVLVNRQTIGVVSQMARSGARQLRARAAERARKVLGKGGRTAR
jgi:hypothetical protein